MILSPAAQSLVAAAVALVREDGPGFIAALKAHAWKQAALEVALAELKLAAAAGAPGAAMALRLAPLATAFSIHPADPASPAQAVAVGGDGGRNISTGA